MDPSTLAILANIAEFAEYVGTILSAIKTASEILGQPDKQQDVTTKQILAAIAQAESSILDAIHTEKLNEYIGTIEQVSRWWGECWLDIVRIGMTFETVDRGHGNATLLAVEQDLPIKRNLVVEALGHFNQVRESLPPTVGMLQTLLGAYSLHVSMETVWKTFAWVRNLKNGDSTPPSGLLDQSTYLDQGQETINAWVPHYIKFRGSQISMTVEQELGGDETDSPRVYEYTYFVRQDPGDSIIKSITGGTRIGSTLGPLEGPAPGKVERLLQQFVERQWAQSPNGAQAVEAVFGHWNGVKTQIGLLLRND